MNKLQELDRLNRLIQDTEIRLKAIKTAIELIDKEISVLSPQLLQLEQNLEFLKKNNTIPIAHEFKKTKSEMLKTKTRLGLISADKIKADKALIDTEIVIEKFRTDYQKTLLSSENNVLQGNFGRKNGKR